MRLREQLSTARPQAADYAESLASLPDDIAGIRGRIGRLVIYPIKSLGGLDVPDAQIFPAGLATDGPIYLDRGAMLGRKVQSGAAKHADRSSAFERFTQREEGALALVKASRTKDGILRYSAFGMRDLLIEPDEMRQNFYDEDDPRMKTVQILSGGEVSRVAREAGRITSWVRQFLQQSRLNDSYGIDDIDVLLSDITVNRSTDRKHARGEYAPTIFSDGGQYHTTSSSTLQWMNESLQRECGSMYREIAMDAFRPNIVLDDLPPNVEDIIDSVSVGEAKRIQMLFGGLCVRCDVTRVDPATGRKPDTDPLTWLRQHRPPRPDKKSSTTFGVNTIFPNNYWGGRLKVGEPFDVVSEKGLPEA